MIESYIFYSEKEFYSGGRSPKPRVRVSASSPELFDEFCAELGRRSKAKHTIHRPRGVKLRLTDKIRPHVMVDPVDMEIVERFDGVEIPDDHMNFLMWELKKQFWLREVPGSSEEMEKSGTADYILERERWYCRRVLESGRFRTSGREARGEEEIEAINYLERLVEKIDLGQCFGLNWTNYRSRTGIRGRSKVSKRSIPETKPTYPQILTDYWLAKEEIQDEMLRDQESGSYLKHLLEKFGDYPPV